MEAEADGEPGLASVCGAGEPLAAAPAVGQPQCKSPGPAEAAGPRAEGEGDALRRCRESLCAEFALVTGMDQAAARCILEDNQWLLETAINSYFEAAFQPSCSVVEATPWFLNRAGLQRYSPDVVFLQEVTKRYYYYIKQRAVSYILIAGENDDYFSVIMLHKSRVKLLKEETIDFPTSIMMRVLLVVQVNIAGNELYLMTSHLESTKDFSKERVRQLGIILKKIREVPDCATVIFGGDTNLRDHEVRNLGGLPAGISDVWESLNRPEHCRYTWDTTTNDNLEVSYCCRLCFDRVFYRASRGGQIIPKEMRLVGQERLECGRFCSDHWGLLCGFDVLL